MKKSSARDGKLFLSVYSTLLRAYPRDFRQEYGPQMAQLMLDCRRDARSPLALTGLWLRTFLDLVRTVPREHLQEIQKENHFMNRLRTDLVAIVGCVLLITAALLLLNYGRSHQVASILFFGYVLDAIAFTGIVGNLIVFLLLKLTSKRPLLLAFWTFLLVTGIPAIGLVLIGGRIDPNFRAANVLIGYVVSFFFWYGLHWLWAHKASPSATT
jgi:hypothetical protein